MAAAWVMLGFKPGRAVGEGTYFGSIEDISSKFSAKLLRLTFRRNNVYFPFGSQLLYTQSGIPRVLLQEIRHFQAATTSLLHATFLA